MVVGGGDGTLYNTINQIGDTNMALGILPLGTMNLTARDVGMPIDPVEAAKALAPARSAKSTSPPWATSASSMPRCLASIPGWSWTGSGRSGARACRNGLRWPGPAGAPCSAVTRSRSSWRWTPTPARFHACAPPCWWSPTIASPRGPGRCRARPA
ncbi:hypothetical protein D3874_17335 [Oleomonas cavernae]|uniref:DAGKc domain-containing protein n=1 Tax=Oleomonas cavernae TaxID=2320859 RepID=A0A418WEZ3_9PROT|nr:hypothetical protein D3874_17335 [Oleomonas cavernae]